MDGLTIIYAIVLILGGIALIFAPYFVKADERKTYIQGKAQSYAFVVIIGILVLEAIQKLYVHFTGGAEMVAGGISTLPFLTIVIVIYAVTLLKYKIRYGG